MESFLRFAFVVALAMRSAGGKRMDLSAIAAFTEAAMQSRALTPAEVALARSIFGDAVDYSRVRLFRRKWWPFQPRNAAMAPNGNIYFHPEAGGWSDDFAREPLLRQGFFIHEMTHVWQAQHGGKLYLPLMRHPFCRYRYRFVPGRPFDRYGIEQQAEIVRHVFEHREAPHGNTRAEIEQLAAILPWGVNKSPTRQGLKLG